MKVDTTGQEIAAICSLLEQWLHVDTFRSEFFKPGGGAPFGLVTFVKAEHGKTPTGTPAREVRAYLTALAEDALDALDAAGWHLTGYPEMEFTGSVTRFKTDDITGELIAPSQQYAIGLKMRFEIDRPRAAADAATVAS